MIQLSQTVSLVLKLALIGFLVLLLWLPTLLIGFLVAERAQRRDEVQGEVSSSWGGEQTLQGPVLSVPYRAPERVRPGQAAALEGAIAWAHFLPEQLQISGQVEPVVRNRSLYEVVLYSAKLEVSGAFQRPDLGELGVAEDAVLWERAVVSLGLGDLRGLREVPRLAWADETVPFTPGSGGGHFVPGLHARLPEPRAGEAWTRGGKTFSFALDLNGSGSLSFVPIGSETRVELASPWPHPSFSGAFLPEHREIADQGFTASWKVLYLNRDYPQQWLGTADTAAAMACKLEQSDFGVRLVYPVDAYQRSTRSVKYSMLFTVLTLVGFLVVEHGGRRPIHPVQYLVIACALCLFYLLLLSLSELIRFNLAYLVAAAAIVVMITAYARAILGRVTLSALAGGVLLVVYGSLYVMLQLEDLALLLGTLLLLILLATVMVLTRRLHHGSAQPPAPDPPASK